MGIILEAVISCMLFIEIPVGIIIFFIVSLIRFRITPEDSGNYKKRKIVFIVSALLAVILVITSLAYI